MDSILKFLENLSPRGCGFLAFAFSLLTFGLNWVTITQEGKYYPVFVIFYGGILPPALALIVLPTRWLLPVRIKGQRTFRQVTTFGLVLGVVLFAVGVAGGLVINYYIRNGF